VSGYAVSQAGGLLDAIVAAVRTRVARQRDAVPLRGVAAAAERRQPRGTRFREAIAGRDRINVIAECKRRSPARGLLARAYRPADIARAYEAGGAVAVSVLTEPAFFDGALEHLEAVRQAIELPVLRKDFMVDEYQLFEARAAGADAVLLIVTVLGRDGLRALATRAAELELAVVVEVHSRPELDEAAASGAAIIGVNSRNLRTLDVDLGVCDMLVERAPTGAVMVAESGVRSRDEILRLRANGYHAFLIGEHLMTAADPRAALASLVEPPPERRGEDSGGGG
jgi:indole-3-glycerol phosphate synthase